VVKKLPKYPKPLQQGKGEDSREKHGIMPGKRLLFIVLGLSRTGLIFTGLQEGAQPGGGG